MSSDILCKVVYNAGDEFLEEERTPCFTEQPNPGETFTIGWLTFTFTDKAPENNLEVLIGGDYLETAKNSRAALRAVMPSGRYGDHLLEIPED